APEPVNHEWTRITGENHGFETRSAPTSRRYPRDLTFYLVDPSTRLQGYRGYFGQNDRIFRIEETGFSRFCFPNSFCGSPLCVPGDLCCEKKIVSVRTPRSTRGPRALPNPCNPWFSCSENFP